MMFFNTLGTTKLVRCTCETDHCNAESADWMQKQQVSSSSAAVVSSMMSPSISSAIPFHLLTAIYILFDTVSCKG